MTQVVMITGATGSLGQAAIRQLEQPGQVRFVPANRTDSDEHGRAVASSVGYVFHLAGVSHPADPEQFWTGNVGSTKRLLAAIDQTGRPIPLLFASSIRAADPTTLYGETKLAAEALLLDYARRTSAPVAIFRLPALIGTWSRPDYNSAVATFCHYAARGLPIIVNTPDAPYELVRTADVLKSFTAWLRSPQAASPYRQVSPTYHSLVGLVANSISAFARGRNPVAEAASDPLERALFETFKEHRRRAGQ